MSELPDPSSTCRAEGCELSISVAKHRLCMKHYYRFRTAGIIEITPCVKGLPTERRFWPKVNKAGPVPKGRPELGCCWLWTASLNSRGYGQLKMGGIPRGAHCVAYELTFGRVPDGLELDHLCRNKICVNPTHLEPVTHRANMRRIPGRASETHCKHGHEFTPESTGIGRGGYRECLTCRAAYEERRKKATA